MKSAVDLSFKVEPKQNGFNVTEVIWSGGVDVNLSGEEQKAGGGLC